MIPSELAVRATASGISRVYQDGNGALSEAFKMLNTSILPALGQGVSITFEYFHDLAGRYVTYLIYENCIDMSFSLLLLIVVAFLFRNLYAYVNARNRYGEKNGWEEWTILAFLALSTLSVFFLAIAIDSVYDIVKLVTVPEVQVYEELNKLYFKYK